LGDGLLAYGMLFGVADGFGDLILFESKRVLKEHFDGRAYVEKEIVSIEEQRDRDHGADGSADCGSDDGAFRRAAGSGHA
jgi:hypothetical protein